ncbi:trehalose utilization protein [Bacillus sp. V-88]|nr:trehalose utilization protein ThuA [Bacillus sp. DSM 27956]PRX79742.1 trehalose utilization protein [Bacillus sp. V-88]SLK03126.1 Trehalose utilization protein [Bacillus sp. V-88]
MINVTIWNEYRHEQNPAVQEIYPDGIHQALAGFLQEEFVVKTATLDEEEHGLTDDILNETDVLIWWGHIAHDEVSDHIVEKVKERILDGMGFIPLHSAHNSKVFKVLMGTRTGELKWREADDTERLWVVEEGHPIVNGIPEVIELEKEEMYGERFGIPKPDELIFISWFSGGEVFRSGCTYRRGRGKIFYFRPGHETYPTYYHKDIQRVIRNAVLWASPEQGSPLLKLGNVEPLESR